LTILLKFSTIENISYFFQHNLLQL